MSNELVLSELTNQIQESSLFEVVRAIRYCGQRNSVRLEAPLPAYKLSRASATGLGLISRMNTIAHAVVSKQIENQKRESKAEQILLPEQHDLGSEFQLHSITNECRVLSYFSSKQDDSFAIKLQIKQTVGWTTIAWYESRARKAFRFINYADGSRSTFQLDLPYAIVKNMANQDFQRNWQMYLKNFQPTTILEEQALAQSMHYSESEYLMSAQA